MSDRRKAKVGVVLSVTTVALLTALTFRNSAACGIEPTGGRQTQAKERMSLVVDNSASRVEFTDRFSTSQTGFWAYELRAEFSFSDRYVLQAGFLRGIASGVFSWNTEEQVVNTFATAGVGYRFGADSDTAIGDRNGLHRLTAFLGYQYLGSIGQSGDGVVRHRILVGIESRSPMRWKSLVSDAGLWLAFTDRDVYTGLAKSGDDARQTLLLNLGVGYEFSRYAALMVSREMSQQLPNILDSEYAIWRITFRSMF